MNPETLTVPICGDCGAEAKKARMPRGWKRVGEDVFCVKCFKRRYVLRAITIPVAGPVDDEWAELRAALKEMWTHTTGLCNWLVSHYYAADVKRLPGMDKLPNMPKIYLYPSAREAFPEIPSQSVAAIDHAVSGKYRSKRFDVIWRASESLPNYRYPTPFPVAKSSWRAQYINERPVINARIGDQRWNLRLRDGHQFRRQLAGFDGFVTGDNLRGELSLYSVKARKSDHRNGIAGRDENRRDAFSRVMCKMVGYFPRKAVEKSGTLYVHTDPDALLVAVNVKNQRLWVENCDNARRWIAEHRRRLQRWSDDRKAEQRPVASFQGRASGAVKKYHDRLSSLTHEVSAHLVKYAKRRRFAVIQYNDKEKSYCPEFPWASLVSKIEYKCDGEGIVFERLNGNKNTDGARNEAKDGEEK